MWNSSSEIWTARKNFGHQISEKLHKHSTEAHLFGTKKQEIDDHLHFKQRHTLFVWRCSQQLINFVEIITWKTRCEKIRVYFDAKDKHYRFLKTFGLLSKYPKDVRVAGIITVFHPNFVRRSFVLKFVVAFRDQLYWKTNK